MARSVGRSWFIESRKLPRSKLGKQRVLDNLLDLIHSNSGKDLGRNHSFAFAFPMQFSFLYSALWILTKDLLKYYSLFIR
jgi:hypothetical protein